MDTIPQFVWLLIPIVLLEWVLKGVALVDLLKPGRRTRGPQWLWIVVIFAISWIGPIVYLAFGREEA